MRWPLAIPQAAWGLRLALLSACVLAQVGWKTALADIAPMTQSGGTNIANRGSGKTKVAMVDEVVKLRVSRTACHVDVVFTMQNTGDVAETMSIGFPFYYADELKEFKATVDDAKVTVTTEKGGQVSVGSVDQPAGWKAYWHTWKTTFPPGKPVKITVSYWTKLSTTNWSWNIDLQRIPDLLTSLVPKSEQGALQKQLEVRRVTYVLRTGSDWSGPIGRCRIEVSFDGLSTENLPVCGLSFQPKRATVTADKIVWDLKDFEPKSDVEFRITPSLTRKAMLQLLERLHKQAPQNTMLTASLVDHLSAERRQPEADATMLKFLNDRQDKVVIWGPKDKQSLSLEESVQVFKLIQELVETPAAVNGRWKQDDGLTSGPFTSFRPLDPQAFVPAIQRIAQRVKEQAKQERDPDLYYAKEADAMLAWCQKHAK